MLHACTNNAIIRVFVAHSWMAPAPDDQRNREWEVITHEGSFLAFRAFHVFRVFRAFRVYCTGFPSAGKFHRLSCALPRKV